MTCEPSTLNLALCTSSMYRLALTEVTLCTVGVSARLVSRCSVACMQIVIRCPPLPVRSHVRSARHTHIALHVLSRRVVESGKLSHGLQSSIIMSNIGLFHGLPPDVQLAIISKLHLPALARLAFDQL